MKKWSLIILQQIANRNKRLPFQHQTVNGKKGVLRLTILLNTDRREYATQGVWEWGVFKCFTFSAKKERREKKRRKLYKWDDI